jgi:hypothetical protein
MILFKLKLLYLYGENKMKILKISLIIVGFISSFITKPAEAPEMPFFSLNPAFPQTESQPAQPLATIVAPYQAQLTTIMDGIHSEITPEHTLKNQLLANVYASCTALQASIRAHQQPPRYKVKEVNPHRIITFLAQYLKNVKEIQQAVTTPKRLSKVSPDIEKHIKELRWQNEAFLALCNEVVSDANKIE